MEIVVLKQMLTLAKLGAMGSVISGAGLFYFLSAKYSENQVNSQNKQSQNQELQNQHHFEGQRVLAQKGPRATDDPILNQKKGMFFYDLENEINDILEDPAKKKSRNFQMSLEDSLKKEITNSENRRISYQSNLRKGQGRAPSGFTEGLPKASPTSPETNPLEFMLQDGASALTNGLENIASLIGNLKENIGTILGPSDPLTQSGNQGKNTSNDPSPPSSSFDDPPSAGSQFDYITDTTSIVEGSSTPEGGAENSSGSTGEAAGSSSNNDTTSSNTGSSEGNEGTSESTTAGSSGSTTEESNSGNEGPLVDPLVTFNDDETSSGTGGSSSSGGGSSGESGGTGSSSGVGGTPVNPSFLDNIGNDSSSSSSSSSDSSNSDNTSDSDESSVLPPSSGGSSGSGGSGGGGGGSNPVAVISGAPGVTSSVTTLDVTISGTDVATYSHKVGLTSSTNCQQASGYSAFTDITNKITNDISSLPIDNSVTLCVRGKSSGGTEQALTAATSKTWRKVLNLNITTTNHPTGNSPTTNLNIDVDGVNLAAYRYKIGPTSEINCSDPIDYSSNDILENVNITNDISSIIDGNVTLCILGRDSNFNWEPLANPYTRSWDKNAYPEAVISNIPLGPNLAGNTSISISGSEVANNEVVSYRYKVVTSIDNSCSDSTGYSAEIAVGTTITENLTGIGDGVYMICVVGKDSAGVWQPFTFASLDFWFKFDTNTTVNMCDNSSHIVVANSGTIYDPGGPSAPYANALNCSTLILSPNGAPITLSFTAFDTQAFADYLRVYDGIEDTYAPIKATLNGNTLPADVTANSGSMFLRFTSSALVNHPGFEATWSSGAATGPLHLYPNYFPFTTLGTSEEYTYLPADGPQSYEFSVTSGTGKFAKSSGSRFIAPKRATSTGTSTLQVKDQNDDTGTLNVETYNRMCVTSFSDQLSGGLYDEGGGRGLYENNSTCTFLIRPLGKVASITLQFHEFNTQASADIVTVYDGVDEATGTLLGTFSGTTLPGNVTATRGSMFIKFATSVVTNAAGFRATWTSGTQAGNIGLIPDYLKLVSNEELNLFTLGDKPPYIYDITSGEGKIDIWGKFTAPTKGQQSTVQVTDAQNNTGTVTLTINDAICKSTQSLKSSGSILDSGGFRANYQDNEDCTFLLAPAGKPASITLDITEFNTQNFGDFLRVYDGIDDGFGSTLLGTFTGTSVAPTSVTANTGSMFFRFTSGPFTNAAGFLGNWSSLNPEGQVALLPTYLSFIPNQVFSLTTAGENSPFTYSVVSGGGSISTTGVFTAPSSGQTTRVRVTDSQGNQGETDLLTRDALCLSTQSIAASGSVVDDGGLPNNYSDNKDCTFRIVPPGKAATITLDFSSFRTQNFGDFLRVYDGFDDSPGNPILGTFSGTTVPGSVVANSGMMFLRFTSGVSTNDAGFLASWTSANPAGTIALLPEGRRFLPNENFQFITAGANSPFTYSTVSGQGTINGTGTFTAPASGGTTRIRVVDSQANQDDLDVVTDDALCLSTTSTNATGTIVDEGGINGNYLDNKDCTFLIAPTGASQVTISFNSFRTQNFGDIFYVYDGTSTSDPLLGSFSGTTVPGDQTANSGKMFIRFVSGANTNDTGFDLNWTSN